MTMAFPKRVSTRLQPKYVTLVYCFILMSLHWMFRGFKFLILCLLPNKIDFVLSSPKWILNLSTNQSQSILKLLFSAVSISVIFLSWNIKQVPSIYNNTSQSTACGISIIYNKKSIGPKMHFWETQHRRFPGSEKLVSRFRPFYCFSRESYKPNFFNTIWWFTVSKNVCKSIKIISV